MAFIAIFRRSSFTVCVLLGMSMWSGIVYGDSGQPEKDQPANSDVPKVEPAKIEEPAADQDEKSPNSKKKDGKSSDANSAKTEKTGKPDKSRDKASKVADTPKSDGEKTGAVRDSGNKPDGDQPGGKKPVKKSTADVPAGKAKTKNAGKGTAKDVPNGGELSAADEKQALEFASQHHPELVELIAPLKGSNPKEYQRAIRELFRTSQKLENIRLRAAARYELELQAWKLHSNVRLLAARLVMEPDPKLQEELKEAIRLKATNRVRMMELEKETLQTRLEQVNSELAKSSKSVDLVVDQEYERLLKQASRDKPKVAKGKKRENP
jgi:hypothetical protein